jgi:hypothetical protein
VPVAALPRAVRCLLQVPTWFVVHQEWQRPSGLSVREHQGCPCHAWRGPSHDSPTTRERPRPHADVHRVASPLSVQSTLIAVPLYLAIRSLSSNPAINPSCTRKRNPPALHFCFVVVEHCPAHTDTFLPTTAFTLTLHCLSIPRPY